MWGVVWKGDVRMAAELDDALPSALDCRPQSAVMEAEKASEYMRKLQAAEAEKKELLDRLAKPSGVSDEERMKRAAAMIKRAVNNGLTEVEIGRFSNKLCTDGGACHQPTGAWLGEHARKELYQFWKVHLQPRGYRVKFQIADWPNSMPGDTTSASCWLGVEW